MPDNEKNEDVEFNPSMNYGNDTITTPGTIVVYDGIFILIFIDKYKNNF